MRYEALFAIGIGLSTIAGRINLLAKRGGINRPLNWLNLIRDAIGGAAGICFWAILVWGFSTLNWYVALPITLAAGLGCGMVVTRASFWFFTVEPALDMGILLVTAWLWVENWPY